MFQSNYMDILKTLYHVIFNLKEEYFDSSIQQTMKLFDSNYPYSFNLLLSSLIYCVFYSQKNIDNIYLDYLKIIQTKEEELDKNYPKIIEIFLDYIRKINTQETYYIINKMLENNLIDINIIENFKLLYFVHYDTKEENKDKYSNNLFYNYFIKNYEDLKKNDWELHKKYVKEGHNPNEIAKIIRNDEIEKLQEISSQSDFDFNQTIKPSLYERCSFINQKVISLIKYAAFFGSVKCFKYLLMNGANTFNAGKYAIAGGNLEIIHFCEQNHSSFKSAYETAIKFHQNDIFKYIYENKLEKLNENLFYFCVNNSNYEILLFLEEEGMKIDKFVINETAKIGNLFLTRHFLEYNQIPTNIIVFASESGNIELVKYVLKQDGVDINSKDFYLFYLMFIFTIL